ncbi:MAG: putative hydrophobic protein (TIGR00271 family) [Alcanivorax sp.]
MDETNTAEAKPIATLLYDPALEDLGLKPEQHQQLTCNPWPDRADIPADARVLVCLGDEKIRDLVELAMERKWELGVLPHPDATEAMRSLGVKGSTAQLITHYLDSDAIDVDVLLCNGQVVFSSVVVGKVMSLRPTDMDKPVTDRSFLLGALKGLGSLRLKDFRLLTGKDQTVQMAALGVVVLGYTQSSLIGKFIEEPLSLRSGRLTLLAFAPRSIISYLWFLLRLTLGLKISLQKLPNGIGTVQSKRLVVTSSDGMELLLDSKPLSADELVFEISEQALRIIPGPMLQETFNASKPEKDVIRTKHVPVNETAREFFDKPLPLFSHASEAEYRELFVSLRINASPTHSFQVLTVLSVLLALAGLYANSAPVIIGAMILAPLMSPIISLAMGMARTDFTLLRNSLITLAVGVGWGLGWAVAVAALSPLSIVTPEMAARMSPTLLDLFIAVISGVAGAYAFTRAEIAKSLAGVAIAVALVPPLSVMGIGLGWANWDMALGAGLLFTTNLVGISLAASVTFLVLGFAPFHLARKGLTLALGMMAVIAIPLTIAFSGLIQQGTLLNRVPTGYIEVDGAQLDIGHVEVRPGAPPLIRISLSAAHHPDEHQIDALKAIITEHVGEPIVLEADFILRR